MSVIVLQQPLQRISNSDNIRFFPTDYFMISAVTSFISLCESSLIFLCHLARIGRLFVGAWDCSHFNVN